MYTKIYWLYEFSTKAKLGIMSRPRGNDWLEDEIMKLANQKVQLCISLLETEEIIDLGLNLEHELCKKHGITYINYKIKDRSIPFDNKNCNAFISLVYEEILKCKNVVIHCRMGIGRSSIIAARLMNFEIRDMSLIIKNISSIRGISIPDTEDQLKWLLKSAQ